jgi:hypothetical protein
MKRFLALVTLAIAAVAVVQTPALADQATTILSIRVSDDTVSQNDTIIVRGKLSCPDNPKCKANKLIRLYIDGSLYGTTTTNDEGRYRFEVKGPHPVGKHKFQTKFKGTTMCAPDKSSMKTVTVQG